MPHGPEFQMDLFSQKGNYRFSKGMQYLLIKSTYKDIETGEPRGNGIGQEFTDLDEAIRAGFAWTDKSSNFFARIYDRKRKLRWESNAFPFLNLWQKRYENPCKSEVYVYKQAIHQDNSLA